MSVFFYTVIGQSLADWSVGHLITSAQSYIDMIIISPLVRSIQRREVNVVN